MKFYISLFLILLFGINYASGKISQLLVSAIGEGIVSLEDSDSQESIATSSFLPNGTKLSVRPKSGIETLAAGYLFRFGSSTTFICQKGSIEIFSGSLFVRSRKFQNSINIVGPEISIVMSGSGSCLIEVEKNGGFKCVGLLGSLRFSLPDTSTVSLLPGDLVFTQISTNSFSDKVTVDLENLFGTSFLISGFPNSTSFGEALKSVAQSQKQVIGKSYNATIGETTESDQVEVIKQNESGHVSTEVESETNPSKYLPNYKLPNESPLDELLGRSPKRFNVPTGKLSGAELPENTSSSRPFPSRLLRGK